MSKKFKGIGSSEGIGIAKVFLLEKPTFEINENKITDKDAEIKKIKALFEKTTAQIMEIKDIATKKLGAEKAEVFEAHAQIVNDPEIISQIENLISSEKFNAAYAINKVFNDTHDIFANMEDEYFKQRASDINDIKTRMLANFLNVQMPDIISIKEQVIIVADDLTPSETALLDKQYVKGFLTNIGGRTSHAAIMARTMEIPAVLGLKDITKNVKNGQIIALNGKSGEVELEPSDIKEWESKLNTFLKEKEELKKYINVKAKTLDGHNVDVEANIGKPEDANNLDSYGAEGVGLFRSEFLYMENSDWPTEDEQFEAYKHVLEKQKNHLVIVRTLDIGGDKKLNYYTFDEEMNPFLGYRAIRFCLDNKEVFRTQIRALLRASVYGRLGIMFPMIATVDEFLEGKKFIETIKKELDKENIKYSNNVLIGMMVEIPSTALLADKFAQYADFFSIGTNDLVQYTFAVDRMSQKVSYLYQPNNPSLLRAVKLTIEGAKKHNKIVAMCGEMAGDIKSIPLLLGLGGHGLDAFSMTASSIPKAKKIICSLNHKDCIELANKAIECDNAQQVNDLVDKFLKERELL